MSKQAFNANRSDYAVDIPHNRVLDARSTQTALGRYANNCRTINKNAGQCSGNNAKLSYDDQRRDKVNLKATKNIPANREVFVRYGRKYWEG